MRVTIYKNSLPASILSIIGTMFAALGILQVIAHPSIETIIVGVIFFAMGFGCMVAADNISESKKFEEWRKRVQSAGLEPIIRQSVADAVQIYQTCPGKHTLGYISALNPEAGQFIAAQLQNNAKKK